ncbi:outer membrane protein assembly factor BamB family protein [Haladaptatus sp. NG-SE-30]
MMEKTFIRVIFIAPMNRRRYLTLLAPGLTGITGCLSSRHSTGQSTSTSSTESRYITRRKGPAFPAAPASVQSSSWQLYRHDKTSTGRAGRGLASDAFPLAKVWDTEILDAEAGCRYPAVADGIVCAISSAESKIVTFESTDGSIRWTFDGGEFDGIGMPTTPPAISGDTVYVGFTYQRACPSTGCEDASFVAGRMFALDRNSGAVRWTVEFPAEVRTSPIIADDNLVVGDTSGAVTVLDAATGVPRWRTAVGDAHVADGLAVADGTIYVGGTTADDPSRGYLVALDGTTGTEQWRVATEREVGDAVAVGDGMVYAGTGATKHDGYVLAVDAASGEEVWRGKTGRIVRSAPAIGDGLVYATTYDTAYAFDAATGEQQWRFRADDAFGGMSSPVVDAHSVYIDPHVNLYALDRTTGAVRWSATDEPVDNFIDPVIADGRVYVGSASGRVYGFESAPASDS